PPRRGTERRVLPESCRPRRCHQTLRVPKPSPVERESRSRIPRNRYGERGTGAQKTLPWRSSVSRDRAGAKPGARGSFPGARHIYRSEEHTSELQSRFDLVCRLLLEKKNTTQPH